VKISKRARRVAEKIANQNRKPERPQHPIVLGETDTNKKNIRGFENANGGVSGSILREEIGVNITAKSAGDKSIGSGKYITKGREGKPEGLTTKI